MSYIPLTILHVYLSLLSILICYYRIGWKKRWMRVCAQRLFAWHTWDRNITRWVHIHIYFIRLVVVVVLFPMIFGHTEYIFYVQRICYFSSLIHLYGTERIFCLFNMLIIHLMCSACGK